MRQEQFKKTIRLRGHHLLCILPYIGKGYTEHFSKTFDAVIEQINHGAIIEIVSGLDDICAGLHDDKNCTYADKDHCFKERAAARDAAALEIINNRFELNLAAGRNFTLKAEMVQKARELFQSGALRPPCQGCEWFDICTEIAADNFKDVKLFPLTVS